MSRTANLLGAAALAGLDRVRAQTGRELSAAAALVALQTMVGGGSIEELRRVLGLSHSGGVRLVRRLRDAGLVSQERDAADRRAVRLRLTAAGDAEATRIRAQRLAALDALLAPLDAAAREHLDELLELMLTGAGAGRADARRLCRLCDPDVCGHPAACPVTRGVGGAGA